MKQLIIVASLLAGIALRAICLGYVSHDMRVFLLPWYGYYLQNGWSGLAKVFTNYTPFYNYMLLGAVRFDGMLPPLALIKGISIVFELATAILAYATVRRMTPAPQGLRPSLGFAAVWLAPTAVFNGALWGQSDALWTFFIMVAVAMFCAFRNGVVPFGVAVAIKAQAVFLGPFVLAMAMRRRVHWLWLAAIPAVYLLIALPTLVAGRPLTEVATIYLSQAQTFRSLSMHAANFWLFVPNAYYREGAVIGIVCAAAAGAVFSVGVSKSRCFEPQRLLLLACASLLFMPYVLPKMHDRYFYPFEIASIVLACVQPRFAAMAIIAQVDGILSYVALEGPDLGLPIAAVSNGVLLVWLARVIRAGGEIGPGSPARLALYAGLVIWCAAVLPQVASATPPIPIILAYSLLFLCIPVQVFRVLPQVERGPDRVRVARRIGPRGPHPGKAGAAILP